MRSCSCGRRRTHDTRFHHRFHRCVGARMDHRSSVIRYLAGLAVLLSSVTASSQHLSPGPVLTESFANGGWKFTTPTTTFFNSVPNRTWTSLSGGGLKMSVPLSLGGPVGNLPVVVSRTAAAGDIAAAVARCLVGATPLCLVGGAAATAYLTYRVYRAEWDAGAPHPADTLVRDPGVPTVGVDTTCWKSPGISECSASPTEAMQKRCVQNAAENTGGNYSSTCAGVSSVTATANPMQFNGAFKLDNFFGGNFTNQTTVTTSATGTPGTSNACPASIHPLNPAYSLPAGLPPDSDGRCKTSSHYHAPITPSEAANLWVGNPPLPAAVIDAAKDALAGGQTIPGVWAPTTGPASQEGPAKNTTTTDATGTTTTTSRPTFNYNYNTPGQVTYTTTNTTNTCVGAGSCSSEDATTTVTTTTPDSEVPDPEDPCTKFPDRVGCAKLSTAEGPELPEQDKQISISPESGFGADNGVCPGLVHTSLVGDVDPFGLVCTYMSGIRYFVIGISFIMATLIFLGRVD